jgi:hypothetical protein
MSSPAADSFSTAASRENGRDVGRLLIFAAVAASAFLVALGPISDGDIYWHLAAGREIVQRRELLRVDPFTLSAAGRPWTDTHWLFQLGAYATYRGFGFLGLAIAKSLLMAVGAVVLTRTAERTGGASARASCAVTLTGGLLLARHLLPMRPVLVTLVCMAIFLSVLEPLRTATARPSRAWLVLPLVQVLWCNCQGLAPIGPLLVAMYLAGVWLSSRGFARWPFEATGSSALRPLALALALCLLASLASPYGLDAVFLPLRLLGRITPGEANIFSSAVAENIPPFLLERTAPELIGHFKWVLLGMAVAFAVVRPRLHVAHLFVLMAFLCLALMANRNVPLFYWVASPVAAIAFAPGMQRIFHWQTRREAWFGPWQRSCAVAGLTLLLGAELGLAVIVQTREPALGMPTPFHFPVETTRLLAQRGVSGPVFAADQHGGYLSFTVPALRPYIDTRLVLHTGREYADYLSLFDDPARFDALDAQEKFNAVVLTTAYPDRYLGLIWHLSASSDWRLVWTDGVEVLFLRQGTSLALGERPTIDAILYQLALRFGAAGALYEAARLHLARLLVVLGKSAQAEYVLSGLDSLPAARLRARAHFVAGEHRAAESLAQILLVQDPRDVRSLALLAEIAVAEGQTGKARDFLRRALALDPYDSEACSLVHRLEDRLQDRPKDLK